LPLRQRCANHVSERALALGVLRNNAANAGNTGG
jgi:hypothetical protein